VAAQKTGITLGEYREAVWAQVEIDWKCHECIEGNERIQSESTTIGKNGFISLKRA